MQQKHKFSHVEQWISIGEESYFQKGEALELKSGSPSGSTLSIDPKRLQQVIKGFGYTLTEGSAILINAMEPEARSELLQELFGGYDIGMGISYLRLGLGSTDLSPRVYSYNDLPPGETDPELLQFSIEKEQENLIPLIKEIQSINRNVSFMASPWSAPAWMKTNNNTKGGRLNRDFYEAYAMYFVKYIEAMAVEGISIDCITVQNEPHHGGNQPSMLMSWKEQAEFIKNHLGPAFRKNGISTGILIWDHNADEPEFPIKILDDQEAREFIDGSAFHLYAGSISALSKVRTAHPDKNIYFTEQWYGPGSGYNDFLWHIENVLIGSIRNWSTVVLEWNLAADKNFDPHTPGGCDSCMGALSIDGDSVQKNPGYYSVGHFSPFIEPGSRRVSSSASGSHLANVAFLTPEGSVVLVVLNKAPGSASFSIVLEDEYAEAELPGHSVATYVFR